MAPALPRPFLIRSAHVFDAANERTNMKLSVLTLSLALLAACAADDAPQTVSADSSATPSTNSSAPATGGRTVQAQAQEATTLGDKSRRAPNDLTRALTYFDGESERTVWISNELVAEIGPTEEGRARVLQFDSTAEQALQPQAGVRLWRLRALQSADEASRTLTRDELRFSPVVHETASSASPRGALPGGAVATFPADWDRARIDAWLAKHGTSIVEPAVLEANMFLVASAPGLASIELATRLHATGEIVSCTPNFWREVVTR